MIHLACALFWRDGRLLLALRRALVITVME